MAQEDNPENQTTEDSEEAEIPTAKKKKRSKKKKDEDGLDPNAWMVTFSDLITLMMTFFVLLFAFNDPNPKKIQNIESDTQGLFGLSPPMLSLEELQAQTMIRKNLEIFLAEKSMNKIQLESSDQGLIIKLPTAILFKPKQATLTSQAIQYLTPLVAHLKKTSQRHIRIEGHTDTATFEKVQDVWKLSLQRSRAVLAFFLSQKFDAKRLSLLGKGDSELEVKSQKMQDRSKNRRVEIILLDPSKVNL